MLYSIRKRCRTFVAHSFQTKTISNRSFSRQRAFADVCVCATSYALKCLMLLLWSWTVLKQMFTHVGFSFLCWASTKNFFYDDWRWLTNAQSQQYKWPQKKNKEKNRNNIKWMLCNVFAPNFSVPDRCQSKLCFYFRFSWLFITICDLLYRLSSNKLYMIPMQCFAEWILVLNLWDNKNVHRPPRSSVILLE